MTTSLRKHPIAVSDEQWHIVQEIIRKYLACYDVWAFGSRARGAAKPFSDLDLAVISDRPLDLDRLAAAADAFSASDLPWKVDLVDWAATDPAFRSIIETDKVVIHEAEPSQPTGSDRRGGTPEDA